MGDLVQNGVHAAQGLLTDVANSPVNIYTRTPPELTYAHPAVIEAYMGSTEGAGAGGARHG